MNQVLKGKVLQIILLASMISGAISLLFLNLQDTVVHTTLYDYGLQFSLEWANIYWLYLRLASVCIGVFMFTNLVALFYIRSARSLYSSITPSPELKSQLDLTEIASPALLFTGITALIASILISSSILAFIGLGLSFWGALFLYVRKGEYIQETLLGKTTLPSLTNVNKIITNLGFKGQAIYLPPTYLKNPESSKVFIAKEENANLKTLKQAQEPETIFVTKPESILITPPGADLVKLFEKTLNTSFIKVDLGYLVQNLPNLLINDLEIAKKVDFEVKENQVNLKIMQSIYTEMHKETKKLSNISVSLGCPICSAIACAITRATGKPVTIETHRTSEDGNTINTNYHIH